MVFHHDESHAVDDYLYFYNGHSRQVHCIQLDSVAGWEDRDVDKDKAHDGEKDAIYCSNKYLESKEIISFPNNKTTTAHAETPNLPKISSDMNDGDSMSEMKQIRCREEDLCMVACKRARLADPLHNNVRTIDNAMPVPSSAVCAEPIENGNVLEEGKLCSASVEMCSSKKILEDNDLPGKPNDACFCYEEVTCELPIQNVDSGHLPNTPVFSEDLFLSLYDRFPRKKVALGPNHQVDVPSWGLKSSTDSDFERDKKLMGTPIIAMPDVGSTAFPERIGFGAGSIAKCSDCAVKCSISCIRRHVAEAREKARAALGHEKFVELGLHDMGEEVALGWTEEEEQVFQDVIYSNPSSKGKNFWNVLLQVFPSRSCKDLVSYYFNVFVLRKRAMQNRSDPWNIDSDNDEWEESDDGDEFSMDDSGQGVYYQSPAVQEDEEDEDDNEDGEDYAFHDDADDDDEEFREEGSEGHEIATKASTNRQLNFIYKSSSVLTEPPLDGSDEITEEQDAHDDSCTSFEGKFRIVETCADPFFTTATANIMTNKLCRNYDEECRSNPGSLIPGSCDPKEWDGFYFSQSNKVDFLPTCHVIEEVFGKNSWDSESRGNH